MFGISLLVLWAASAYGIYEDWGWTVLCVYALSSYLLRTHLPRIWGYVPMQASDAYMLLPPYPVFVLVAAVVSKTNTASIRSDLEKRVFPNKVRARMYPVDILGKAYWAEDKHFHLDEHVITVKQSIASMDELGAYAGSVVNQPFPPNKPLWCAYIVEDFMGDSAVIVRFHHVYQDGMSWVNTLVHNSDPQCPRAFFSLKKPDSWRRLLTSPLALLLIPYGLALGMCLVPDSNPLTRGSYHGDRTMAMTPPLPLSLHLARAKALGVTFNDYVIAAVLRAVSAYITQHHGTQHDRFTIGISHSLREQPKDGSPLPGNDITLIILPMPAATSATLANEVHTITKQIMSFPVLIQSSNLTLRALTLVPKAISHKFLQTMGGKMTINLSNLQGPKAPLSYAGVHIKSLFTTPVTENPITASVVSYGEHFTLTFTSDCAVIKDASVLTRIVTAEFMKTQDSL